MGDLQAALGAAEQEAADRAAAADMQHEQAMDDLHQVCLDGVNQVHVVVQSSNPDLPAFWTAKDPMTYTCYPTISLDT